MAEIFSVHAEAQLGRVCSTSSISPDCLSVSEGSCVHKRDGPADPQRRAEDYADRENDRSGLFASVKNKSQVIEEHDSMTSVVSAVEAGTGVAVAVEALGYAFGNRVKLVRLTPEPKPISFGIAARKGRLSPAGEKFWQCAKESARSGS